MQEYTLAPDEVYFREVGEFYCLEPINRSCLWEGLRNRFVKKHPFCATCKKNKDLQLHHVRPFHLWPELELTESNLVVLCRTCHLYWGHLGDWKSFNLDIDKDIDKVLHRPYERKD